MDLSSLSSADLQAIQKGDMSSVSVAGLKAISGQKTVQSFDSDGQGNLNPTGSPAAHAAMSPTSGMSGFQQFAAGAGKAPYDLARGTGQLLGMESRQDVANSRAQDSDLMNTSAGKWGNLTGNVAQMIPAAFIPGANTLAGAAAIGAGTGLLQPSTSTGETAANVGLGGVAGPGGLLAGRAVGAVAKGAKAALWDPFTSAGQTRIAARAMQNFAGSPADAQAASASIGAPRSILPGVQPTTAELANNAGIAQLERSLQNNPEYQTALTNRQQANAGAVKSAVQGIAGTDAQMTAAQQARSAATSAMYDAAGKAEVPSTPELERLLQRPSMSSAWSRAQQLAAERGDHLAIPNPDATVSLPGRRPGAAGDPSDPVTLSQPNDFDPFKLGGSAENSGPAISSAASPKTSSLLDPMSMTLKPPAAPVYSGKTIQYLKMALNDMANSGPQNGMGSHEVGAVKGTLSALNDWTQANVPALRAADAKFAELSKPINQMQVGQQLSDKLIPALNDFGSVPRLNANSFAGGMRNGDQLAANATGFKGSILANTLSPDQMTTLNQVGEHLARRATATDLGRATGSNTAQNLVAQNVLGQFLGPLGLPQSAVGRLASNAFGRSIGQLPTKLIYGAVEPDVLGHLTNAALDPKLAQSLLQMSNKSGAAKQLWRLQGLLSNPASMGARGLLNPPEQ